MNAQKFGRCAAISPGRAQDPGADGIAYDDGQAEGHAQNRQQSVGTRFLALHGVGAVSQMRSSCATVNSDWVFPVFRVPFGSKRSSSTSSLARDGARPLGE